MKMNKSSPITNRIVATSCLVILPAVACLTKATPVDTVEITKIGYGAERTVTIWGGGYDGVDLFGGVYMFRKTGGTGEGNLWDNGIIGSFCMEPAEEVPVGTTTYEVVLLEEAPKPGGLLGGPIGQQKADYIRELWGRFYDPAWVDWLAAGGQASFTAQQNSDAAAFAAAIYEIVYEDVPPSPLGWDVTVDGTAGELGMRSWTADTATANEWLHALDGTGPRADLRVFVYEGKQDYLVLIPEPATITLLAISSLALLRKRRN
jgi:hypothetical protein